MATITEQLTSLANTKTAIKDAIVAKGVQVADDTPFSGYADKIGEISGGGEPVEKTKFGVGIDIFLGDVDAEGNYVTPSKPFEVNLVGVKRTSSGAFSGKFKSSTITKFIANDLIEVAHSSFSDCCTSSSIAHAEVNNIETVSSEYAFQRAFQLCYRLQTATFNKLKTISGAYSFQNTFQGTAITSLDNVFPSLEYVSGNQALGGIITYATNGTITLSKVKKITGSTGQYASTFDGFYVKNTVA